MHIERLTKLAELLESHNGFRVIDVEGDKVIFDLSGWSCDAEIMCEAERAEAFSVNCNTSCCAVGLAAMTKWFSDQGLHLEDCDVDRDVMFNGYSGWHAVQVFFELGGDVASNLFSASSYEERAVPSQVAARIRALLATT